MREIKFRAWDKNNPKYVRFYEFPGCAWRDMDSRDAGVIEQFTGLKDRNGKEIYEGDIVADPKGRGVVLFTAPAFTVQVGKEEYCDLGAGKVYPDNWQLEETEVIGNIHENPELVKP